MRAQVKLAWCVIGSIETEASCSSSKGVLSAAAVPHSQGGGSAQVVAVKRHELLLLTRRAHLTRLLK